MAVRTSFQLCVVFTIGLLLTATKSDNTTESSSAGPSLDAPPLTVRLWRPPQTSTSSLSSSATRSANAHSQHNNVRVVARGQLDVKLECPVGPADNGVGTSNYKSTKHKNSASENGGAYIFTWLHNGRPIDFANETNRKLSPHTGTLTIPKFISKKSTSTTTTSLEGEYTCIFANAVGTVIGEKIVVKLPMIARSFIAQPIDTIVPEGGNVVFNCRIASIPDAKIHWERDSAPITSPRTLQLPNGALMIYGVGVSDEGLYSCIATNNFQRKSRRSNAGKLTVLPANVPGVRSNSAQKPEIVTGNKTQTIITHMGQNLTLLCAGKTQVDTAVRWQVPYNSTLNLNISYSNTLLLHNITGDDARDYTCVVYNQHGNDTQVWSVQMEPYFIEIPKSIHVPPAKTVRLNCTASGWPRPDIIWLKDGAPIKYVKEGKEHFINGRITIKSDMLVVADTVTSDSGFYECIAKNSVGERRSVARVLIKPLHQKLPPLPPPSGVSCRPYSPHSICLIWDPPPPFITKIQAYTIHYMPSSGGTEQQNATNETHWLVESLIPDTDYSFYLRAYIREAASEQSVPIVCRSGTRYSDENHRRKIHVEPESPDAVLVRWQPLTNDAPCGSVAQYKIQWRRSGHPSNSVKIITNDQYQYRITDLIPAQTYQIRILTTSSFNDDLIPWISIQMPANQINETHPRNKISLLSHLEAVPVSPSSINVSWHSYTNQTQKFKGFFTVCYMEATSTHNCGMIKKHQEITFEEDLNQRKMSDLDVEGDDDVDNEEDDTDHDVHRKTSYVKTTTNSVIVTNLRPFTLYKFLVQAHPDGNSSESNLEYDDEDTNGYSRLVECRTFEGTPNAVRNLGYKHINGTTKKIEWQPPSQKNGILRNFTVFYTDEEQLPLHQWNNITVPPNKYYAELVGLKLGADYHIIVIGETNAGRGKTANLTILNFHPPYIIDRPGPRDDLQNRQSNFHESSHEQTIAIIIGLSIAVVSIFISFLYLMFYRRCSKPNMNSPRRNYNAAIGSSCGGLHSNNEHQISASSGGVIPTGRGDSITTSPLNPGLSETDSQCSLPPLFNNNSGVPRGSGSAASSDDRTGGTINLSGSGANDIVGESHEMQCLVHSLNDSLPPHIPPVTEVTHLDTKGGPTCLNGHLNGFKYPLIGNGRLVNGVVRITENPQYDPISYGNGKKCNQMSVNGNNNCDKTDNCRIDVVNRRHLDEKINGDIDDDSLKSSLLNNHTLESLNDDDEEYYDDDDSMDFTSTLNSTKLTQLENSLTSSASSTSTSVPRKLAPPLLGPNG